MKNALICVLCSVLLGMGIALFWYQRSTISSLEKQLKTADSKVRVLNVECDFLHSRVSSYQSTLNRVEGTLERSEVLNKELKKTHAEAQSQMVKLIAEKQEQLDMLVAENEREEKMRNYSMEIVIQTINHVLDESNSIIKAKQARIEDLLKIQRKAQYTTIKEPHLRTVIQSTLKYLGVYTKDFEELLIMTACIESEMGRILYDHKKAALGMFQILPSTERDILNRWLVLPGHEALRKKVLALKSSSVMEDSAPQLMTDIRYQVALAACQYLMRQSLKNIPSRTNLMAMSVFYKMYYNTYLGAAQDNSAAQKYKMVLFSNEYASR